ncbi:hypothetical protein [Amycolatopsis sp. CA-230715]|uniref:hypothetical protein n=1 Tax=Amycolatopsis sp. CA-230715 TaxID=2745196 RepID=UPI001C0255E7|nr:hypothetical protein [Amycolatopsis sp. CA-230715]QWF82433.1 hypothetical protein HUW46_05870 [Amycolatopsis sp. CA-230715]
MPNPKTPRRRPPAARRRVEAPSEPAVSTEPEQPAGEQVSIEEVEAAVALADRLDRPVRIPPERRLDTGLADYAMWFRMFSAAPSAPPPSGGDTRAGRIWA